ncbi:MAG: hypothetical protein KF912_09090 [Phycisphaeraceae bacterium]|nr:hypothetical protein [Phycisphaeraceae bacterium]
MSDQLPEGLGPVSDAGVPTSSRRAASVTLRRDGEDGAASANALMDPANQSLAEALRITFHLLQGAMVVIAALFLLSGFRSVREGEVGIRLLFGRASGGELPPGFQPSAPYPFGDMVKVQRAGRPMLLDSEFWPYVQEKSRDLPIDRLPATNVLRPGIDGSLITGDSNIAHTRWRATYRRADALKWAENVHPEQEDRMLRSIISRGVIHAVAQTPIERLLKQSSDDQGSVASMAKELAQSMIDDMGLGIEIERLYLDDKVPPLRVRPNFIEVESAASKSAKERADAEGQASETLSAMAGEAAVPLLGMITSYEVALSTGDSAEADRILSKIHAVLDGEPVEVDGEMRQYRIAGEVSAIMSEARLYASREVSARRAEYSMFKARADQFAQNPDLTLRQAWLDAYTSLQSRDMVQTLVLPSGARGVELIINQDPQIIKDLDRAYKRTSTERAAEQRRLQQQRDKYRTETGVRPTT